MLEIKLLIIFLGCIGGVVLVCGIVPIARELPTIEWHHLTEIAIGRVYAKQGMSYRAAKRAFKTRGYLLTRERWAEFIADADL